MAIEGFRFKSTYDLFVSRVQSKLKVVVILDPSADDFRDHFLNFPALISQCTHICVDPYEEDVNALITHALEGVEAMVRGGKQGLKAE